tara:strand:+ start:1006 stop:1290 length:285 start_codon:yes stop_codon:yes gene_type:complete
VVGRDTGDTRELFVLFSVSPEEISFVCLFFLLGVTWTLDWRLEKESFYFYDAPDDDDDGDGDDAEWKCEPAASPRERISTLKRKTRRVVVQHEQ